MNERQISSGRLIDKHRHKPRHCIYCTELANSMEHVVPEAIGGRLTADILCATHNGVANIADEPLNKNFAPYVTMLQIPRQRGGSGAEFTARDAADNPVTILAEGFAKQKPLIVHQHDDIKRILRATGDLDKLDSLPSEAFSKKGTRQIIAVISNPEANFAVASDEKITGGVLKMALHFYAAFVSDITLEEANVLLPCIVGEQVAGGKYLRTPFLAEDVFSESWPPR